MKRLLAALPLCLCLTLLFALQVGAQTEPDPAIVAEINRLKAIDNHAHPLRFVAEGEKDDEEYDALTFEEMEPSQPPVRLRSDNPEYIAAWRELYGYKYADMTEGHVRELLEAKRRAMREHGAGYPAWVLDKLGIETMFANRVAMGQGLIRPRFRWVAFDDALLFPLNTDAARKANADYRSFYTGEERLLKRYLAQSNFEAPPLTFEQYLKTVVTPTLERQKREGAVAIKFEAAYLRSLDFADAPEGEARRVYEKYVRNGEPQAAEYKSLQDYLFRYMAREAGRLGLAVHIHCLTGAGSYYSLRGANPLLLEQVFNDPSLRKTNFVLIHGGWPYVREVAFLFSKPNVYADFSGQTFLLYPRELSQTLRIWLEHYPEKVLFGTDSAPFAPEVNWEETGWLTTTTARRALALALTGMVNDGEITRERAIELARMVMRENAIRLYNLKAQ
ncbi:MAG: amidohydrolase [Acidobacteriota bacterium]|nr:amidohydrolase [Acidobacteriota bacterium]